jgi:poly(hydroxyalkanoate) granule-associated protein
MVTRKTSHTGTAGDGDAAKAVSDSAQKIWLAGLGAFERAKAEGPKMFDVLVEQGKDLAQRARGAADEALKSARDTASGAGPRFDKLAQVLEERVSGSLNRLGVLSRGEVNDLSNQVRDLAESVRAMMAANASGARRQEQRAGSPKRRAAAKAGAAKRKVKRAVSSTRKSATQRTKNAVRKTKAKARVKRSGS